MGIRYIQPVAPNSAEGLVARVYHQIKNEFGALVEPFTLHSPSPELLAGAWSACRESLLIGSVRREVKEAVAATVSRINQCPYCVDAHTIMLNAISARNSAEAILHQRDDQIRDAEVRSIVKWAAATRSPGAKVLLSPPFSRKDAPEIIGTALFFHYVNRMASVLLSNTPLPSNHPLLKGFLKRMAGWLFSRAIHRSKPSGASLELLPESELPADFAWAKTSPNIAGAFARFAAAVNRAGSDFIPQDVRDCVVEQVKAWEGKDLELGRHWVEEAMNGLNEKSKDIGRLVLLTALAPYQVDEGVVNAFTAHITGDDRLIGALAWGSFTAARRIGTWLYVL
ncbi:MAG: carboxymuconolactone decarboxylase family protein [Thermodesulfobacteriota bacterium]|nr:carboxymuconolactone decarboxylase family protein [Thermodesulfobacteriota bacterium]